MLLRLGGRRAKAGRAAAESRAVEAKRFRFMYFMVQSSVDEGLRKPHRCRQTNANDQRARMAVAMVTAWGMVSGRKKGSCKLLNSSGVNRM